MDEPYVPSPNFIRARQLLASFYDTRDISLLREAAEAVRSSAIQDPQSALQGVAIELELYEHTGSASHLDNAVDFAERALGFDAHSMMHLGHIVLLGVTLTRRFLHTGRLEDADRALELLSPYEHDPNIDVDSRARVLGTLGLRALGMANITHD